MLDYGFFDITIIIVKILICGVAVMSAIFEGIGIFRAQIMSIIQPLRDFGGALARL
jgi:hypothetical protein